MTDLKDKAISIKGQQYILVKDRIVGFNSDYPDGSIVTELVSYQDGHIVVKAKVTPDSTKPDRYFTGHSQAVEGQGYINKTAALENAETSAVGRALALMGIGVLDSVASADEMVKAGATDPDWIKGEDKPLDIVREPVDPATSQPSLMIDECPVHHVKMFPKKGKYGTFYSHLEPEQGWCNGKGFKGKS